MKCSLILIGTLLIAMLVNRSTLNSQIPDDSARLHSTADWPGFLGSNRDARSNETGIKTDWSAGKLRIRWRTELGKGYSPGSTSRGQYFQLDALDNVCRLRCFDERNGARIWKFEYLFEYQDMYNFDDGPRCTPVIDEDLVFIFGVEGMLHCLDRKDGSVVWSVDTKKKFGVVQNFFGVGSTPAVHEDFLVVMVGGSRKEDQNLPLNSLDRVGSNNTAIVIFNKNTGEVIHQLGEDLASYSSIQFYREAGKIYGVGWMRNNLIGFDIESGAQRWSFPYRARKYESVNAMTPVVRGSQIFVSESYGPGGMLLEVTDSQPRVVWRDRDPRRQSLATHWNTPVLHDGKLYGCHGADRSGAELRCVDWETGKVNWKKPGYGRSSVTYVDRHLIMLDENGRLCLIKASPDSFQLVTEYSDASGGRLPIKYPCWAAPVVSNGLLFVRGRKTLLCLQLIESN